MRRAAICVLATMVLAGCAGTGRVYPMNDLANQAGVPKVSFSMYGTGHGPVTIMMPNGDVLTGEYQVTENASIGFGFAGSHMATGYGFGGGRPVAVSATGPHGEIMNCEGALGLSGHGSLVCEMNNGARYRVMV